MKKLIPLALAVAAMTAGGAWATGPEAAMTKAGCPIRPKRSATPA